MKGSSGTTRSGAPTGVSGACIARMHACCVKSACAWGRVPLLCSCSTEVCASRPRWSQKSTMILCKVLSGRRWLYPVRSVLWAVVPPLYGLLWCSLCRLACVARLGRFILVSVLVLILGLNDVVCHGRQYGGSFMGVFARIPWLVLRMCQAWLVSKIAGGFFSGSSVWGGGLLVVGLG